MRFGENALFHVPAADAVVRIARTMGYWADAAKEVNVAHWLASHHFPAAQTCDIPQPIALRPEEAVALRKNHLSLSTMNWNQQCERWEPADGNDGWGELHLERARPEVAAEWTDSLDDKEERGLKHREPGEGRTVPCPPPLTALLHDHLTKYGTAPDGRLFWGTRSQGCIGSTVYGEPGPEPGRRSSPPRSCRHRSPSDRMTCATLPYRHGSRPVWRSPGLPSGPDTASPC